MFVELDTRKNAGASEQPIVAAHPRQRASGSPAVTRDRVQALVGQAEGLVALTVGCLALGAYLRRDLMGGAEIALSIGAVVCVIGLRYANADLAMTDPARDVIDGTTTSNALGARSLSWAWWPRSP